MFGRSASAAASFNAAGRLRCLPARRLSTGVGLSDRHLRHMLIYSSADGDVVDTSVRRGSARAAEQAMLRMQHENAKMRAALDADPAALAASNLSVALPFVYGGAAVRAPASEDVVPDEVVHEGDDADVEPPIVYPYGIFPSLQDGRVKRLQEGQVAEDDGTPKRRRGRRGRGARTNKNQDFEDLDADRPDPDRAEKALAGDELFRYGSSDPSVPSSSVPCGGCGALLHCRDAKAPGFVPVEDFVGKKADALRETLCQRCRVMREYNVALKVSVSPSEYPDALRHLHVKRAIVLLVVDLLDFPASVPPRVLDLLGTNKRIVLVGNKADLLPQDSPGYLRRVEKAMRSVFFERFNSESSLITHEPEDVSSVLVSARTGFNIEALVDIVFASWKANVWRGDGPTGGGADVYLVGTTNAGKSSIFNALLESDLCKVNAVDRVEKAMTSPVPGTTLNLLKFPVTRPDPHRLNRRYRRLKHAAWVFNREEEERIELLRRHRDRRHAVLRGPPIQHTSLFFSMPDKALPLAGGTFALETRTPPGTRLPARIDPEHPDFASGRWCYDTPGTVSHDQIIGLLTQDEAAKMLPDLPVRPRSFAVKAGQSVFLGGLARVDVVSFGWGGGGAGAGRAASSVHPLVMTVFCSDDLPINIVRTEDACEFYSRALRSGFLVVPSGPERRLVDFPELEPKELELDSVDAREASCEVVLSSAGWVSVAMPVGRSCRVRAWTPGGRGVAVRDPPFLPYAASLRGRRVSGSPKYADDKVFVPKGMKF